MFWNSVLILHLKGVFNMNKEIRFHEVLKSLRESKKLSQTALAKLLSVDQTAVSKYERNIQLPELRTLIKIAEIFDVSTDELIFSTGFSKDELHFIEETKKISVEDLKDKFELVVDDVAATDKEIEDAIKFIKFNRTQN